MRIVFATILSAIVGLVVIGPASARVKLPYRPSTAMSCVPTILRQAIEDIEGKFGQVQVISTHRPGATVVGTGRRSKHADCRAVDFNPPHGKYKEVVAWLNANHKGGIGTYSCGMHHIHIDNGDARHWHKCVGGAKTAKRRKSGSKSASRSSKNRKRG